MAPRPATGQPKSSGESVVRFPVTGKSQVVKGRLRRLSDLLPRRWRRQVVIQGQRFWLPG